MSEILTVKEAAILLKTSCQQICRMIQNEKLPAVTVGREWRIGKYALLDYLGFPY